jgi:hypothetical protein
MKRNMGHRTPITALKSGAVVFVLTSLLGFGCTGSDNPTDEQEATVEQLFLDPTAFDDKNVIVEGFYFHGFETIVLSEDLVYSGHAAGHLVPDGRMMWVEGGIPKEAHDSLREQHMMGPSERYGRLRITGRFQYGERYGHLGYFDHQITASKVELLPWTPIP